MLSIIRISNRTTNVQNIENVEHDLKSTQTVSFQNMLGAFLMRGKLDRINDQIFKRVDTENIQDLVKEKEAEVDKDFDAELKFAVKFCNEEALSRDEKKYCEEIKQHLYKYCEESKEAPCYRPLVDALNNILLVLNRLDVIFVVNDPVIIHSPLLENAPKRKPDIILVALPTFQRWYKVNGNFRECMALANDSALDADVHRTWSDVIQFWELKAQEAQPGAADILKSYDSNGMTKFQVPQAESNTGAAGSSSAATKRKQSEPDNSASTKKARMDDSLPVGSQTMHGQGRHARPKVTPEAQCAYYAIERFRSSWKVSHVSGIYLKDRLLEVLWYDSQGCIRSEPLDIICQLPLLVALISIQLKSGYLAGMINQEIPQEYQLAGEIARRFQLIGRMTCGAYLGKASATASTTSSRGRTMRTISAAIPMPKKPSDATHFFKVSWPEDDRRLEGEIIEEVRKRIRGLDEKHRSSVENHIPLVTSTSHVSGTSTAIIRIILGLPTAGSRSQYWMISKKLSSLSPVLSDFNEFKRMYWEIIRCHRLLWVMGIAHGDISFNNLMFDPKTKHAILNDFDLASTMDPGIKFPPKIGHRRTGTLIFMALDLLKDKGIDGEVARSYHHELESFVWVLLWAGLSEKGYRQKHILEWVDLSPKAVYEKKTAFLWNFESGLVEMKESGSPYHVVLSSSLLDLTKLNVLYRSADEMGGVNRGSRLLTALKDSWKVEKDKWMDYEIPL